MKLRKNELSRIHHPNISTLAIVALTALFGGQVAFAGPADTAIGVTEPVEEIDLAFPDSGIISEILVDEGQRVNKGDLLVKLDSRIHEARRKIAEVKANSDASVRSAAAELKMNTRRYEELQKLGIRNSNADELARAESNFEAAAANHQAAEENAAAAKLELEQIEAEIERRNLRSPIDGIVARVYRDEAESVTGGETIVATVVNLDQLNLVVHLDAEAAADLKAGSTVNVARTLLKTAKAEPVSETKATVVFISPIVNASSGTKRVRLLLPNPNDAHESGVKYKVDFKTATMPGLAFFSRSALLR